MEIFSEDSQLRLLHFTFLYSSSAFLEPSVEAITLPNFSDSSSIAAFSLTAASTPHLDLETASLESMTCAPFPFSEQRGQLSQLTQSLFWVAQPVIKMSLVLCSVISNNPTADPAFIPFHHSQPCHPNPKPTPLKPPNAANAWSATSKSSSKPSSASPHSARAYPLRKSSKRPSPHSPPPPSPKPPSNTSSP